MIRARTRQRLPVVITIEEVRAVLERLDGWAGAPSLGSQRYSFATHLLERGQDICTIQELLSHLNVNNKTICTHVLNRGPLGVCSPADLLLHGEPL